MNYAPGEKRMVGASSRKPLVVIGVGNPDRADDGLGPLVIARLGSLPDTRVISLSRDAFGIIEQWTGAEEVVLIDAAAVTSGPGPGRIHRIDLSVDELPCELGLSSTHAFGLAEAISLARALDRLPKSVIVYAVEGVCFDVGAPMTPEVFAAAEQVAGLVAAEVLTRWSNGRSRHAAV